MLCEGQGNADVRGYMVTGTDALNPMEAFAIVGIAGVGAYCYFGVYR